MHGEPSQRGEPQMRMIQLVVNGDIIEHHGTQCGFCTPGVLMSAKALLVRNAHPGSGEQGD